MKTTTTPAVLATDEKIAEFLTAQGYPCSSDSVYRWRRRDVAPLPARLFGRRVIADSAELLVWARNQVRAVSAARRKPTRAVK